MGRVQRAGDVVGLDMLLPNNRHKSSYRALTFVSCYLLHEDDLDKILDNGDFPQVPVTALGAVPVLRGGWMENKGGESVTVTVSRRQAV